MKIAVIGANGKAGTLVVREATERGHEVTAIMRSEQPTQAQHTLIKDVFALTRNDLSGFDAVVDAFGAWTPESLHLHKDHLVHLAEALSGTQTRLLVIGSAGSPLCPKNSNRWLPRWRRRMMRCASVRMLPGPT